MSDTEELVEAVDVEQGQALEDRLSVAKETWPDREGFYGVAWELLEDFENRDMADCE